MFEENDFVCRHMRMTKAEIIKVIREKNITSFDDLQDETDVATICGSCVADIEEILEEEIAKRDA
ncbi:(2Fe-2S)-binding protein [Carboxylicivirga linearis]|uniref:(2Fe-2S)-binding protein n=1 Tax=Carboxylicivirga linearis TaxID=1628157 RepID=A0ABS5JTF6_9BACT|nr:(2Fe-2S)-binding protein [Carboxylicivirga linearis]MBS2097726.1 (2Fe-2S)-binding protein [Carboxylicivirga linearis]